MWKPTLPATDKSPVYRRIVHALAGDIASGRLSVGARLPPHRDLADELSIARGTVARAYRDAEKLGLIRGEVGRGTLVIAPDAGDRPYASLLEAPTVLSDFSTNLPLTGIDPDPAAALQALAVRADRRALLRYLPPSGLQRHRIAGVRWLRRMGVDATAEQTLPCAGAQHALFITLQHLSSRSRVVYVDELSYPGILGIAELLSLSLIAVSADAGGMSPRELDRACRRHGPGALYLMPTIHNPTGVVMSDARRVSLCEVACAHQQFIIEDAANRMLLAKAPPSMRQLAPERTFLVASVSKIVAAGLRVAFLAAPEEHMPALVRQVWGTQWMVSPLGLEIVAMWLEDGSVDATLKRKRKEARRRQAVVQQVFGGRGYRAHPNALHVWVDLPKPWVSERLTEEAARQGIVVTPSSAFWTRKTPPPAAIRVALGGVERLRELEQGLEKLARIILR